MKNYPLISIVTPTYNQGEYIEETILSIINQKYPNLEYIIIDGGSTDGTVEIIKKYEKHLKYWISEKDNGQVDAIKKGLTLCTGEIFNWINSDDYLEPGSLFKIATLFTNNFDLIAGKVRIFQNNEKVETIQNSELTSKGLMFWLKGTKFVQPGVWLRRRLIYESGNLNEAYHYSFDWDLYIRYLNRFPRVIYTNDLLVHYRLHEQSKTVSSQKKFLIEQDSIIKSFTFSTDNKLRDLASLRINGRNWYNYLKELKSNKKLSKISRMLKVILKINKQNLPHLRMTLGFIKSELFGN